MGLERKDLRTVDAFLFCTLLLLFRNLASNKLPPYFRKTDKAFNWKLEAEDDRESTCYYVNKDKGSEHFDDVKHCFPRH